MTWILVLYFWAGGPATTNVPGFRSEQECAQGRRAAGEPLYAHFACLAQTTGRP